MGTVPQRDHVERKGGRLTYFGRCECGWTCPQDRFKGIRSQARKHLKVCKGSARVYLLVPLPDPITAGDSKSVACWDRERGYILLD
mgnify:CR=1 FL=1